MKVIIHFNEDTNLPSGDGGRKLPGVGGGNIAKRRYEATYEKGADDFVIERPGCEPLNVPKSAVIAWEKVPEKKAGKE